MYLKFLKLQLWSAAASWMPVMQPLFEGRGLLGSSGFERKEEYQEQDDCLKHNYPSATPAPAVDTDTTFSFR